MEIQVNGGTIADKASPMAPVANCTNIFRNNQVDWAREHLEKEIPVGDVFQPNEILDIIGITKGKGFKGQSHSCALTTVSDFFVTYSQV